jgi:hypothetical protein
MRRSAACRMVLPIPGVSPTPAASEMPQVCRRSAATPRHRCSPRHRRHRHGSSRRLLIPACRSGSLARMLSSPEGKRHLAGEVARRSAPSLAFAGGVRARLIWLEMSEQHLDLFAEPARARIPCAPSSTSGRGYAQYDASPAVRGILAFPASTGRAYSGHPFSRVGRSPKPELMT